MFAAFGNLQRVCACRSPYWTTFQLTTSLTQVALAPSCGTFGHNGKNIQDEQALTVLWYHGSHEIKITACINFAETLSSLQTLPNMEWGKNDLQTVYLLMRRQKKKATHRHCLIVCNIHSVQGLQSMRLLHVSRIWQDRLDQCAQIFAPFWRPNPGESPRQDAHRIMSWYKYLSTHTHARMQYNDHTTFNLVGLNATDDKALSVWLFWLWDKTKLTDSPTPKETNIAKTKDNLLKVKI